MFQAAAGGASPAQLSFMATDALVRLVSTIVVHGGGEAFLSRMLAVLVGAVKRVADKRNLAFNGRPYMRVMAGLICLLGAAEPVDVAGLK
jgi:CCR4-NOT transcription complex subunit 1